MTKHLRIWLYLFRMSWMESMEYRLNFVLRVLTELLWYAAQLVVFEVLFVHTQTIGQWDIHGVRVFMGTLFMIDVLYMIFFNENFERFSNLVIKGELDMVLTKPVDSQFMVSVRKMNPVYVLNFLMVSSYFLWATIQFPGPISLWSMVKFAILFVCGFLTLYSLRFFFAVLTLLIHNANSLNYVWYNFYRLGTRPHTMYPSWLRIVITFIVPVGVIVSVPSTHLLFPSDETLWTTPLLTILLLWLSRKAWFFGLSKYSSASS